MRMYSNLVERCFTSCCNDFTSKALSSKEVGKASLLPPRCVANIPSGAMYDELCRQIFEALGASGGAVRGTECRCVTQKVTKAVRQANSEPSCRSYEYCGFTEVDGMSTSFLYRASIMSRFFHSFLPPLLRSHTTFMVANTMRNRFTAALRLYRERHAPVVCSARIFPHLHPLEH